MVSTQYPDLALSMFPNNIDSFTQWLNIVATDGPLIAQYIAAMNAGNQALATQILAQIPNGTQKIITATDLNKLSQAILAIERFYKTDIEPYLENQQQKWQNIINQFSYVGNWASGTQYQENNIVSYALSGLTMLFIATSTPPVGSNPNNTAYWRVLTIQGQQGVSGVGLSYRQEWSSSVSYTTNDAVTYNNAVWMALQPSQNVAPQSGSYWKQVISFDVTVYPIQDIEPEGQEVGALWFNTSPNPTNYYNADYFADRTLSNLTDNEQARNNIGAVDQTLSNLFNNSIALNNIGAGTRQNLLINPFFKINQRGKDLYSINIPQYTLDCWKTTGSTTDGNVSVQSDYIQVYNTSGLIGIGQFIENYSSLAGLTLTLSFLVEIVSGSFQISISDGTETYNGTILNDTGFKLYSLTTTISSIPTQLQCYIQSTIGNSNIKIYAAKLEVGSNQSLAYQEANGNWQVLEQPNQNEILKCYRYQYVPMDSDNSYPNAFGFAFNGNQGRFIFPMPVPMRIPPTLVYLNDATIDTFQILKPSGGASAPITSVAFIRNTPSGVGIALNTSGLVANTPICLRSVTPSPILFDANL